MKEKNLTRGVFYVSGLKRLDNRKIGSRDKILIYGTFYMRKDAEEIVAKINEIKQT